MNIKKINRFKREDKYNSRFFDYQIAYKYLFGLDNGDKIEACAYQHFLKSTPVALAIDVSSMVGCPMNCVFCESALIGYKKNLSLNEITDQFAYLIEKHDKPRFPRIVCSFQGIGEPSLIANTIIEAGHKLLRIDTRIFISISTIGANLNAFQLWRKSGLVINNLQVSCSAMTDEQKEVLMPNLPKIDNLISEAIACKQASNIRQVKINYILMDGVNDTDSDVQRLIHRFRGTGLIVKISALNKTTAATRKSLDSGSFRRAKEIQKELESNEIESYVYGSFAPTNISCGQLLFINSLKERHTNLT